MCVTYRKGQNNVTDPRGHVTSHHHHYCFNFPYFFCRKEKGKYSYEEYKMVTEKFKQKI